MPKGDKFIELTNFLELCKKEELSMTFYEIEKILGCKLSYSAYNYREQWSNTVHQTLPFAWLNAGYIVSDINMDDKIVVFKKSNNLPFTNGKTQANKIRQSSLDINYAIQCINQFYNVTLDTPNARFLSWEHCYTMFQVNKNNCDEKNIDFLSLHLAFYLASWGMYRGSSFLLQKDYKIHKPVLQILLDEKYIPLWNIQVTEIVKETNLNLLEDINKKIRNYYASTSPSFNGRTNNATDTLVTKILLGTLGCVPAYDRYYTNTVKKYSISNGEFNRKSICDLANYYIQNIEKFEEVRYKMKINNTYYPQMKLMDICMWQVGFNEN